MHCHLRPPVLAVTLEFDYVPPKPYVNLKQKRPMCDCYSDSRALKMQHDGTKKRTEKCRTWKNYRPVLSEIWGTGKRRTGNWQIEVIKTFRKTFVVSKLIAVQMVERSKTTKVTAKVTAVLDSTSGLDLDLSSSVACSFASVYPNTARQSYDVLSILQRVRIALMQSAVIAIGILSVWPSVRPSRSSIVSIRIKIRSCGF